MSGNKDWLTDNNAELKIIGAAMYGQAFTNQIAWHLISGNVTDMLAKKNAYETYLLVSEKTITRNILDVESTDDAKEDYKKVIRHMGQYEMKHNIYMTDTQRTACGVPNDSNTNEHAPVATTSPVIVYAPKGRLGGALHYSPTLKDDGQMGIKVKFGFYKKGDPVPTEAACTQTEILGKQNDHVVYEEANFGLLFVGYARYINNRKQIGTVATQFFGGVV